MPLPFLSKVSTQIETELYRQNIMSENKFYLLTSSKKKKYS